MKHSKMIAAKRIAVAVAAVCATMSAPAFAADAKSLLDLMLKKGVITQAEYDEYMKSDAYENQQFKDQRIDQDVSKSVKFMQKREKDGAVKEGGFGLVSANGEHEINLTGRVHFDARNIDSNFEGTRPRDKDTASFAENFELRRARIGINGKVFKDINYELVTNAVGSSANLIDTAWINYGFDKQFQIRAGRFKQPFSLEELTSSNNIDFMERSYVNQFVPTKQLGLMVHGIPADGYTYAASIYQNGFNQVSVDGGFESAARVTANLAQLAGRSDSVMHLGAAATSGSYSALATSSSNVGTGTDFNIVSLRSEARGMSNIFRSRIAGENVSSGPSVSSDLSTKIDKKLLGAEAAFAFEALKLQGEWVNAHFDATHTSTNVAGDVKAYYVEALYNITGERWSENYRDGVFGAVKLKQNFSTTGSGKGGLQVGIRYSAYDATDLWNGTASNKRAGSEKGNTTTLGLTWFLNPNARIMLNYALTRFDRPFAAVDVSGAPNRDKEDVVSLRTQINF